MIILLFIVAVSSLVYASYLHIHYQHRRVRTERQIEVEKFSEGMRTLGMTEESIKIELRKYPTLSDIVDANKKLNKALKKYKLL